MKILRSIAALIFGLILLSASCKKNNVQPQSELSKLPPATQTGADTFGCLINGQAFIPGGSLFSGSHKQCNYIYTGGGYYFTILTTHQDYNGLIKQVQVETDSLTISEGQTLILRHLYPGHANAVYAFIGANNNLNSYSTTDTSSGQLTITKFDQVNQIVSGIFYFNCDRCGRRHRKGYRRAL
jgi:hypothetical protein